MSAILITALFLSPYILLPLFMARAFRNKGIELKWLTYLISAVALLIYPDLFFFISTVFKEPLKNGQGICMMPPVLINILLLPIALLVQWSFHRCISDEKH